MSNLAFFASPVDFQKNDKLKNKIEEVKKNKLNSSLLKKLSKPTQNDVENIHQNVYEENLKSESDNVLADFYSQEMEGDLRKQVQETRSKQNLYLEAKNKDYLISNNLKMNEVNPSNNYQNTITSNAEVLNKLNYIINLFEEQKDVKTNQKNEEIILYSFLGVFVIYVLDSFVYIGKYSR